MTVTTAGPSTSPATDQDAGVAAQQLHRMVQRLFGRSLHIRTIDTGSCAACEQEIRLLTAPHYDLHRLGSSSPPAPATPTCSW
jgi:NADH:ubiquinone oxidoreductase subunit B-like Fe-S oxidoreductase